MGLYAPRGDQEDYMHKNKPNKSATKRVKLTAKGKIKRYRQGSGHLKSVKSPAQLRRFRKQEDVSKVFIKNVKKMLQGA
jgi:large subunit ribosomal protein L35